MVVVGIDYLETEAFGVAGAFIFALEIFLKGVDVGVAIVDGGSDAVLEQTFDNGGRARSTAGVQKHFAFAARNFYLELLFGHL